VEAELAWGIFFSVAVIGVCAAWFRLYGYAERNRNARGFARRSAVCAGGAFVLGLAFMTSDLGSPPMGLIAFTTCGGLLLYAAGWALVASDDDGWVLINLTGRALLLAGSKLAPFYMLPAALDAATALPPALPRTRYVVNRPLARLGVEAGRTDMFAVDEATATDLGPEGLLVRRLVPLGPESPAIGT
jgi:hypothetical protein